MYIYNYIYIIHIITYNRLISLESWVVANGLGDLGSVPGRVIPKTLKMVLESSLLNTQHYEVRIEGKRPPLHPGVVAIEKRAFRSPLTMVANFTFFTYILLI